MIPITFANWLPGHFNAGELVEPGITGPDADPDHEGLSNLIEFALGTLPDKSLSGNQAALPAYSVAPGPDTLDHLMVTWTVNAQVLDSITFTAEAGSDLAGWTPLTALPPVLNPDGRATLLFRDGVEWKSALRRYVRVRVTAL